MAFPFGVFPALSLNEKKKGPLEPRKQLLGLVLLEDTAWERLLQAPFLHLSSSQ